MVTPVLFYAANRLRRNTKTWRFALRIQINHMGCGWVVVRPVRTADRISQETAVGKAEIATRGWMRVRIVHQSSNGK